MSLNERGYSPSELFSMNGKSVFLTGGAGYLGASIAKGLLEAGAKVAVADVAKTLPDDLEVEDACRLIECDLSINDSVKIAMKRCSEIFGSIDVLIHCGVYGAGYGPQGTDLSAIDDDIWQKGIDGTLGSTFRTTREVLPYFKQRGKGVIVNIASMYGVVSPDPSIYASSGQNNPPAYGAGKAGVLQFTRYCAAHLAERNIRVNTIIPGPFPNPRGLNDEDFTQALRRKTMLGRVGIPKELVGAVLLLASEASTFMTGSAITVDGGWTAW